MNDFPIGSRRVGPDHPPYVIAEAGINHEGQLDKALALVDAAAKSGADCIKFQCHITEAEMIPTDMRPGEISSERLWDIIKRCELTADEEVRVMRHCEARGIQYLCTPFSREAADRLERHGVLAYKIGSGECNNSPLIEHVARFGKPIMLSTGMNDLASIRPAVDIIRRARCPLLLFHCTSMYPTPYAKVRLGALADLARAFDAPVGLSDHTPGFYVPLGAVALGACAIEKHFTISRKWPGPDNPISIEPDELAHLVAGVRAVHAARGGAKTILPEEQPVIDFAYASIVAIKDIAAGEPLDHRNVWVKRPGTGPLHARDLSRVLGKVAARAIREHTQLAPADIVGYTAR